MPTKKLSPRKPDLLDELNELHTRRGIAYRAGDLIALEQVHQKMKTFWQGNGWTKDEAHAEFLIHLKECEVPYTDTVDELSAIKGCLLLLAHN